MVFEEWQQWGKHPEDCEKHNALRLSDELPEMESTKQLVNLISEEYDAGMKVLDVGCNVGHYLKGLRRQFPKLNYTGVDAYDYYISQAKTSFQDDTSASFEIKDIFEPLFPEDPFDIVYCCNVLLHLPDFRVPVRNLLSSTKKVCFIRALFANYTNIVKSPVTDSYDDDGNPIDYWYLNTWNKNYFVEFVEKLGWKVEFIDDKFEPVQIQKEFETVKNSDSDVATRIVDDFQIIEGVIANWVWAKITPYN